MKKIVTFLIIHLLIRVNGQNLVTNPGFDIINNCPTIYLLTNGKTNEITPNWYNVNNSYQLGIYNSCRNNLDEGLLGVPINFRGYSYKLPRSGNGYAGFNIYQYVTSNSRQYLQTKLFEKLKRNTYYYGRYYASPRVMRYEKPSFQDGFGLKFFSSFQFDTTFGGNFYDADIKSNKGVIRDTANWTPISGCYKARGDEEWLMIGNFLRNEDTKIETEEIPYTRNVLTFYFFEDVGVYKFDPLPDTLLLCKGESKTYNAALLESSYRWSTGKTDSIETITKPGRYVVDATIDGCVLSDTVVVIDPSVWSGLAQDTLACKETKGIELKVGITGRYEWSTGDTTKSIKVTKPDIYSVTVTNVCSTYVYTSKVDFEECGCRFYSPTAFSPNDDNNNETFKPIIDCKKRAISSYKLSIFNRQGEQVYFSQNVDDTWDGTFRGQKCDIGVFVWVVEYAFEEKGIIKSIIESGDVTLIK
jgi:gliding motility-associated-like protein